MKQNHTIIDRRINPKGKNLSNRQRFLRRAKDWLKDKVRERAAGRQITSEDDESIVISNDDISEPIFDYNHDSGEWDRVLPGNKDYVVGDTIKRPSGGEGKGNGKEAGGDGEGLDEFTFTITRDEYLNILFDGLELPDLVKQSEKAAVQYIRKRSGFSVSGTPNNLDLERSLKNALGRRIALGFPLDRKIKEVEESIEEAEEDQKPQLEEELFSLKRRRGNIAYIDQVDVRYKRYQQVPVPNSQAVVFCLMDVSGSMGEREKEIGKRFFLLLYLFLQRKYQKVDIVFVKHTTEAKECNEEEFFYGKETGGTKVSSGVNKINEIIKERYPLDTWNIYCVQVSDGDNEHSDNEPLENEMMELLPKSQYYVYIEVKELRLMGFSSTTTNVFDVLYKISHEIKNLKIVNIVSVDRVVPVFRDIFTKKDKNGK